jgi:hypothetical protein
LIVALLALATAKLLRHSVTGDFYLQGGKFVEALIPLMTCADASLNAALAASLKAPHAPRHCSPGEQGRNRKHHQAF